MAISCASFDIPILCRLSISSIYVCISTRLNSFSHNWIETSGSLSQNIDIDMLERNILLEDIKIGDI